MLELEAEIRKKLFNINEDTAFELKSLPPEYRAWVIHFGESYGVAVPLNDRCSFHETFSKVEIKTYSNVIISEKEKYDILSLTISGRKKRDQFATLCADFVDPGVGGEKRDKLLKKPSDWWNAWKEMLGNRMYDNEPYSLLGEMYAVEYLMKQGYNVSWTGRGGNVHDIESTDHLYEVKSTTKRYGSMVTISSAHQLSHGSRNLDLIFCRFEESPVGKCVDDLAQSLKSLGADAEQIEEILESARLEPGREARKKRYNILEMKSYPVDENFPVIVPESFRNNQLPEGIESITYTVDLSGLKSENILIGV